MVMVWIGGGAFEHGSDAAVDGRRFARDGVVCVSINYRVGADEFLCLGVGYANCGLLDQIAALQWVHDRIAVFDGDPVDVTVCGGSAVAISIAMPRTKGPVPRAICQSGESHPILTLTTAQRIGRLLAERLGVEANREAMATVPIEHCFKPKRN